MTKSNKIKDKIKEYHFEFKHITVLFLILFAFQLIVSFINKASIKEFINTTHEWYQSESAEEIANLTSTALELVIESVQNKKSQSLEEKKRIEQSFDIIFSQQQLAHNIDKLCLILKKSNNYLFIDDGKTLYEVLIEGKSVSSSNINDTFLLNLYKNVEHEIKSSEQIKSIRNGKTFHTFVPFVLKGEYLGSIYMSNSPDLSMISNQVISNYDETSIIYLSLILLGLLAMYFISSYTVKERDEAQKLLLEEHEKNIKKQITYEKELSFTKRIYHTHHKAEKIMGFIKEDLRTLSSENIEEIKYRVTKYSNFISRVIYDMKWYDPPVQTIRSPLFQTNLNEVLKFIVNNIFLRVSTKSDAYEIIMELDEKLPIINVNEFVVWEIIEPLIQNSIEHGGESNLIIKIKTKHDEFTNISFLTIEDNGKGISPDLLNTNSEGIKLIFVENTTTKSKGMQNSGYGCYIAYEMAKRCGWELDAQNLEKGCQFIIKIKH
ncbi:MAG: ATP-binding protein [Ignavibacteria bacterium]|nr:ATP-binding protein [Ignavibacteria bacterium]